MITVSLFIVISFLVCKIIFYKSESFFVKPDIFRLTFYRDFLLLTMIPYLYYIYDGRYKDHYILGQLNNDSYFNIAALFAFVFIVIFLLTCKLLTPLFSVGVSKFNYKINYGRAFFTLNSLILISSLYFIFVSIRFDGGLIGLLKFSTSKLEVLRSNYTHGGGFFTFNKLVLKSWIPMLSYLSFYLYINRRAEYKSIDVVFHWVSLVLGVLCSIWFFEKSVLFFYFFGLIGIYIFSGGKLTKKITLFTPVLAFFLVSIMYILVNQDKIVNNQYLFDIILHRTSTQATGSVMAVHYFETHEFLYLSGISNSLAALVGETFQSPYARLIDYYVPEYAETSGALSSFAVGEAYGLFGIYGVIISGFVVGIYYSFFESIRESDFFSVTFIGVYGLFYSHFYVASSFYSFLWPVGLVYQVFPFFLIGLFICKVNKGKG
ncbi:O-antigen polymerase [Pseudoalteromonas sp. JSTW]|uniref:O-antigen polymerase n=1 Tax=Pseudoalteromonas sp. JSTW TaxID=2752475 RepID=UPI0015D5553B|nr:O-antigen polymerase [Pseudoalteromonas sp. JSTW]QLJ07986.1 oligosaccharide repeat unit polymerase [Pseudoalteromonas sp. JSTW]